MRREKVESMDAADEQARDEHIEIPRYLVELWRGEDTGRPGPKRGVDLTTIAKAGADLADAEGLGAISMRSVASKVGFTTMALYRYLSSKDELLTAMVDVAYGPPTPGAIAGDRWQERLVGWARAEFAGLTAHPWILQIPTYDAPLTPNQIAWLEAALEAMRGSGMNVRQAMECVLSVSIYVRGHAQLFSDLRLRAAAPPGTHERMLATLIDPQTMPRIAEAIAIGAFSDDEDSVGLDLDFGVRALIDGAAAAAGLTDRG
jgi:AcrR family transcriptional regulator